MRHIWSGFGYELWQDSKGKYVLIEGDGYPVPDAPEFDTTFEAKKWMKEHKTSQCWRADGKWDWTRKERA